MLYLHYEKTMFNKTLFLFLFISLSLAFSQGKQATPLYAYQSNNEWSVVASDGSIFFKSKNIVEISGYAEGLIRAKIRERGEILWAYFNLNGELQFKIDTDGATEFSFGKAVVYNLVDKESGANKYGIIDKTGKYFKPIIYNDALAFTEGLAYVMNDSIRGYIDTLGNMKIKLADKNVGFSFREGLAAVSNVKMKTSYIDKEGKTILPFKYDESSYFSEGLVKVTTNGRFGFVDKTGEQIIPMMFGEAMPIYEGVTLVAKYDNNYKSVIWAVLTTRLKMLTDWRFQDARAFEQGLAAVKYADKWGFINTKGEFAFQDNYDLAESFAFDGLAFVKNSDLLGFIDKFGKKIITLPKAEKYVDLRWNKELK